MTDTFFGATDTGKVRQNNEDTFIAQWDNSNRYIIACVIDGVGGYSGGEVAAEIARETILKRLEKISGEMIPMIIDAFNLANDKIFQDKQENKKHDSMACVVTLAIIDLKNNQFYYAHVGDTRLYLVRDGSLVKITHDQSFVGFMEDSGRLTEKEAMTHPKRNEIDKALGFKNFHSDTSDYIETGQSPFLPDDLLLLCSDGLTDLVDKDTMTGLLMEDTSLQIKANALIDTANQKGGKDNVTVVLVKNDKTPLEHHATKPLENATPQKITEPFVPEEKKNESFSQPIEATVTKKNYIPVLLLTILTILLAGACVAEFLYFKNKQVPTVIVAAKSTINSRNAQEIKLQNAIIHSRRHFLILSDTAFKSPVIISQPIGIDNDTLYIKNQGKIIFQADSGYHLAAFALSSKTKKITLDSLYFQNFDVALSTPNNSLILKNVRFKACKSAVQQNYLLNNTRYINGSLTPALFKTDSLPIAK